MTNYSHSDEKTPSRSNDRRPFSLFGRRVYLSFLHLVTLLLLIVPLLYLFTLARTLVLGDPSEFTFVANILGIAHPPGYAFITILGKLFQTLIPVGTIPWRMHLLSATSATVASLFVYGTVRLVGKRDDSEKAPYLSSVAALFAALSVGTAVDIWQHAIHANPHIITATFLVANLFFLTKWWVENEEVTRWQGDRVKDGTASSFPARSSTLSNKWLYVYCVSAGLGVSHHPLTVFGFPAYAIFILWVRPGILREGRTLLKMMALALLGLSVWLYFPIRSPMEPAFGPSTMNTLDGFLDHVLARGLTETLPYYSLAEQPGRALVFWTLLRLQYSLPVIFLSLFGVGWLHKSPRRALFLLYFLAFISYYAFVISLKIQDIMAYLLGPFLLVGLFAGIGLWAFFSLLQQRLTLGRTAVALIIAVLFGTGPILQVVCNTPRISLRDYNEGEAYVDAVFERFKGTNQGAVLLNDWEHMTPLWYMRFVEDRWPDEADVRPEFVSAARTWLENVFDFLPGGPVYLSNYRRDVVDAGFRLRPAGPFYQVVEPGESTLPPELKQVNAMGGEIEIIGYGLPERTVTAGDYVPLILAMRAPQGTNDFYVPLLRVGEISFPSTTDSHLITPAWEPGEIIVERFDFPLPHDLAGGSYPMTLDLENLSADQEIELSLSLGQLSVTGQKRPISTDHLLVNFRQRVGLLSVIARTDGRRINGPWPEPIVAKPGDIVDLTLKWQSLALAEESYTVFIHLIDLADRPVVDHLDYTPLGGATPTHLWIPKWLPGQQMLDPYRLPIPPGLDPGTYRIEVGLYEMVSRRRLHISDAQGNLVGDRYILGDVIVGD